MNIFMKSIIVLMITLLFFIGQASASWSTNGSTTPAWISTTLENSMIRVSSGNIVNARPEVNFGIDLSTQNGNYGAGFNCLNTGLINTGVSGTISYMDIYTYGTGSGSFKLVVFNITASDTLFRRNNSNTSITMNNAIQYQIPVNDLYIHKDNETVMIYGYDSFNMYVGVGTFTTYYYIGSIKLSDASIGWWDSITSHKFNYRLYGNYSTSSNVTAWYDSGSGNEIHQIDVNVTTPINTNYTVNLYNNITSTFVETLGTGMSGNQSLTITSPLQDAKINITSNGNQTATPELIQVTFFDQAAEAGTPNITSWGNNKTNNDTIAITINTSEAVNFNATANQTITTWNWAVNASDQGVNYDNYTTSWATAGLRNVSVNGSNVNGTSNTIYWNVTVQDITPPSSITGLTNTTGNFWHNWTWTNPLDADFNYTMIYLNGSFVTNTSSQFYNLTASAHNSSTLSTQTVDFNENMNGTWVNLTSVIPNNEPVQSSIGNKNVIPGQWLNFTITATDVDSDTTTYGTNASNGSLNTTTGNFNWSTTSGDVGTHTWNFNSSDAYGGMDSEIITITVNVAPSPNITSWSNNYTNNNNLSFIANIFSFINFNVTANQTITTWNWLKNDVNQNNNYDNLTTEIRENTIMNVSGTNINGTSNTISWNVTANVYPKTFVVVS